MTQDKTGIEPFMFKPLFIINCLMVTMIVTISGCSTDSVKPENQTTDTKTSSDKPVKAVKVSISSSERVLYKKGLTALNSGDYSAARSIFDDMLSDNPNLAGPHSNLALIHYKKKEYTQSFKMVEKALLLNPQQAQAYNLRGQLYIAIGKVHEAKADDLKAIKLKPDYSNAQYNLALVYDIYLQEIELAIKHYNIYISLIKKPDVPTKEWISHLKGTLKDE